MGEEGSLALLFPLGRAFLEAAGAFLLLLFLLTLLILNSITYFDYLFRFCGSIFRFCLNPGNQNHHHHLPLS